MKFGKGIMLLSSCFAMIFICCGSDSQSVYDNEEKWVPIMADMYAAQTAAEASEEPLRDSLFALYREQIVQIHDIEQEDLSMALEEIASDPEKAVDFYDKVIEYLNELDQQKENHHH